MASNKLEGLKSEIIALSSAVEQLTNQFNNLLESSKALTQYNYPNFKSARETFTAVRGQLEELNNAFKNLWLEDISAKNLSNVGNKLIELSKLLDQIKGKYDKIKGTAKFQQEGFSLPVEDTLKQLRSALLVYGKLDRGIESVRHQIPQPIISRLERDIKQFLKQEIETLDEVIIKSSKSALVSSSQQIKNLYKKLGQEIPEGAKYYKFVVGSRTQESLENPFTYILSGKKVQSLSEIESQVKTQGLSEKASVYEINKRINDIQGIPERVKQQILADLNRLFQNIENIRIAKVEQTSTELPQYIRNAYAEINRNIDDSVKRFTVKVFSDTQKEILSYIYDPRGGGTVVPITGRQGFRDALRQSLSSQLQTPEQAAGQIIGQNVIEFGGKSIKVSADLKRRFDEVVEHYTKTYNIAKETIEEQLFKGLISLGEDLESSIVKIKTSKVVGTPIEKINLAKLNDLGNIVKLSQIKYSMLGDTIKFLETENVGKLSPFVQKYKQSYTSILNQFNENVANLIDAYVRNILKLPQGNIEDLALSSEVEYKLKSVKGDITDWIVGNLQINAGGKSISTTPFGISPKGEFLPGFKGTAVEKLQYDLSALPGAFDAVSSKAKSLGISLENIRVHPIVDVKTGLIKLDAVAKDTAKSFSILGRVIDGVFKVDIKSTVEDYLITNKLSKTRELAEQQSKQISQIFRDYGFTGNTELQVKTEYPTGVTFFTATQKNDQGIQQMTISLDKYGKVLTHTNRRLLDFTDAIVRNTAEVFKWSVGATLIYGTYRKLDELIKTAIDNETKLAQITIILGNAQLATNELFSNAAKIAKETGENINGVLEAYTAAYRAVGDVQNPLERTEAANKLLSNALVLSKLSALSTAESIDILSAALRQIQQPSETLSTAFEKGTYLLDTWVTTTRKANVDLATLATAFSVVQEAAENAGMSIEQINALIAVISEKTGTVGGKETGNIVRALIGNLSSDRAANALQKYGISVRNASGELRNFLDISMDIYNAYSAGLIDERAFGKLAYTIGDGVRNAQRFQLFLSDVPKVFKLASEQTNVAGVSQEALSKSLDTTQTAVTKLGNAFQTFAQILGTKGGVLDATKTLLDLLTGTVTALSKLTDLMGSATIPAALTLATALAYQTPTGRGKISEFMGSADRWFVNRLGERLGTENAVKIGRISLGALTGGLIALDEIQKIQSGESERWISVGFSIAGGVAAALTGNPVWMLAGATVGKSFVDSIIESRGKLSDFLKESLVAPGKKPVEQPPLEKPDERLRKLDEIANKLIGGTFGGCLSVTEAKLDRFFGLKLRGIPLKEGEEITSRRLAEVLALALLQPGNQMGSRGGVVSPERRRLAREFLDLLEETRQVEYRKPTLEEIQATPTFISLQNFARSNADLIKQIVSEQQDYFKSQYYRGLIKPTEYRSLINEQILGMPSALGTFSTVKGINISGINQELLKTLPNIEKFGEIFITASTESGNAITAVMSSIVDLSTKLEASTNGLVEWDNTVIDSATAVSILNGYLDELSTLLRLSVEEAEKLESQRLKSLMPQMLDFKDITNKKQLNALLQEAQSLQDKFFGQLIKLGIYTEEDVKKLKQNAEPIMLKLGEELGLYIAKGIVESNFLTSAFENIKKEGLITSSLDYQFMDVTYQQFQSIMSQYEAIRAAILKAGGTSEETPLLTFFKDSNSPIYFQKDWKIVQYLLSQILETEKKQLDGIYNLPSEATAWVPFQSLQYAYNKGLNEASGTSSI
ncbi:MAG: phage tail tape measure protein, partial [Ignavibacterium sp.]